jgi:cytochrome c-type biogenesis protein
VSVAETFVDTVTSGSLLLAVPVAAAAGLVSFLSPCVLPLVPGYLSFVTGLSGQDLGATVRSEGDVLVRQETALRRGRVVLGASLFVLGFSAVFVTSGALLGALGEALAENRQLVDRVLGVVTVALGLVFLGLLPGAQRTVKLSRLPNPGLAGAPLLGVVFGLGWTPCLGPTLAAVQTLAFTEASAERGALLTLAYCLGLGVPFVLTALAFRRALGAFDAVKRHYALVMRIGGGLLVVVGLLLVSGLWEDVTIALRSYIGGFETAV